MNKGIFAFDLNANITMFKESHYLCMPSQTKTGFLFGVEVNELLEIIALTCLDIFVFIFATYSHIIVFLPQQGELTKTQSKEIKVKFQFQIDKKLSMSRQRKENIEHKTVLKRTLIGLSEFL